jgi:hypothetical protein
MEIIHSTKELIHCCMDSFLIRHSRQKRTKLLIENKLLLKEFRSSANSIVYRDIISSLPIDKDIDPNPSVAASLG